MPPARQNIDNTTSPSSLPAHRSDPPLLTWIPLIRSPQQPAPVDLQRPQRSTSLPVDQGGGPA
eukprot:scaffold270106_cov40-Tisochrysis_lutea.AAC.1